MAPIVALRWEGACIQFQTLSPRPKAAMTASARLLHHLGYLAIGFKASSLISPASALSLRRLFFLRRLGDLPVPSGSSPLPPPPPPPHLPEEDEELDEESESSSSGGPYPFPRDDLPDDCSRGKLLFRSGVEPPRTSTALKLRAVKLRATRP